MIIIITTVEPLGTDSFKCPEKIIKKLPKKPP